MRNLMDVSAGVSGAITIVKQLLALRDITRSAEAKLLVAELHTSLADVKTKLAEIMLENLRLKDELAIAVAPPQMIHKDGVYFRSDGDGPFCTTCFDSSRTVVRLTEVAASLRAGGKYQCNLCKSRFQPYKPTSSPVAARQPKIR